MILLFTWLFAYNLISVVINCQFEWHEHYPADDYYFVGLEVDEGYTSGDLIEKNVCDCEILDEKTCNCKLPVIFRMPNQRLALGVPMALYTGDPSLPSNIKDDMDEYFV
jgi:hypothetical protein